MTREEARFTLLGPLGEHFGHRFPEGVDDAWLDCWIALGMLKLDEQSATERAVTAMLEYGHRGQITPRNAIHALNSVGLKIVEKEPR
jgi:hypothetical protein